MAGRGGAGGGTARSGWCGGVPVPIGRGRPGQGYPFPWSVHRWLDGESLFVGPVTVTDQRHLAIELGRFVAALQQADPADGPPPGTHNFFRGVPLAQRDTATRAAIRALHATLDTTAVTAAWDVALQTPPASAPAWIHGDLLPGNLLARDGRLSAVIDFGGLAVGDPACDLMAAWTLLPPEDREIFRTMTGAENDPWARGRGWALSFGLIALPYYQDSNPTLARIARHTIDQVLADHDTPPGLSEQPHDTQGTDRSSCTARPSAANMPAAANQNAEEPPPLINEDHNSVNP